MKGFSIVYWSANQFVDCSVKSLLSLLANLACSITKTRLISKQNENPQLHKVTSSSSKISDRSNYKQMKMGKAKEKEQFQSS